MVVWIKSWYILGAVTDNGPVRLSNSLIRLVRMDIYSALDKALWPLWGNSTSGTGDLSTVSKGAVLVSPGIRPVSGSLWKLLATA